MAAGAVGEAAGAVAAAVAVAGVAAGDIRDCSASIDISCHGGGALHHVGRRRYLGPMSVLARFNRISWKPRPGKKLLH
jgi:hypothetical protein